MNMTSGDQYVSTGIPGLDTVLGGGVVPDRMYLLQGHPGNGKTTFSLQFIQEGLRRGEAVLYISLSQTERELHQIARSHGWDLSGMEILELPSDGWEQQCLQEQSLFQAVDTELEPLMELLKQTIREIAPRRLVIDSVVELRLLANDPLIFRRRILELKLFLETLPVTTWILDDLLQPEGNFHLASLVSGTFQLEQLSPSYGNQRRRLRVFKLRGQPFQDGYHDFRLQRGGLVIYPRLDTRDGQRTLGEAYTSGLEMLDEMLDGGLERGSSTLILGPAGTGKSSLATLFATSAVQRGHGAALYLFEEGTKSYLTRSDALGMCLSEAVQSGRISLRECNVTEMTPGEFAQSVCQEVRERQATVVIIDSIAGYLNAMPNLELLLVHLHDLVTFLSQQQVLTILVMAQHDGVLDHSAPEAPLDISYMADTVMLLNTFQERDRIRQSLVVSKKRHGVCHRILREMHIDSDGIHLAPLATDSIAMQGVGD